MDEQLTPATVVRALRLRARSHAEVVNPEAMGVLNQIVVLNIVRFPKFIIVPEMVRGSLWENSYMLKSKHHVATPELGVLRWNQSSLVDDIATLGAAHGTEINGLVQLAGAEWLIVDDM